ncbi:MAG: hypothetical protein H6Q67_2289 [Firmicutes bacterium]|nr:hypothetical protein [Bacillota bacterium]
MSAARGELGVNEEKYTEKAYLQERLEHQIRWYDQKSRTCQKTYKIMKLFELLLSSSIPLIIGFFPSYCEAKFLVSLFGATLAIFTGIHGLYNFHERWIQYRFVCEALRHEKYLFVNRCGRYKDKENPLGLFVERIEAILSQENTKWAHSSKCSAKYNP